MSAVPRRWPADNVTRIVEFDFVEVHFVACEMHDHARNTGVLRKPQFRQIAAQEVGAARDVVEGEFGAVDEVNVAIFMAYVTGVVKQRGYDRHLGSMSAQPFALVDAALVPRHEARERQRHVERMLHVVVGRVAAEVARITACKQPLEIVEGEPEIVERGPGKGLGEQLPHRITHVSRIADLHGVCHVVIVTSILGHGTFLVLVGRIARCGIASGVSHAVFLTATRIHSHAGGFKKQ